MLKYFFYIGIFFISSCRGAKTLNVYYENSSAVSKEISIETYLDGNLIDKRTILRGDTTIHWELLSIELPNTEDSIRLQFKIPETADSSECHFVSKRITNKTWMHVALNEVVFKKGYIIPGRTLDKDSVMERSFYCQLVDRPR